MRIISGQSKGKKLVKPTAHSLSIRPTTDKNREALFNIIGDQVKGAVVLDLFAGTGALGLEALSRGADHIVFIDNNQAALSIIRKNCDLCLGHRNEVGPFRQNNTDDSRQVGSCGNSQPVTILKRDLRRTIRLKGFFFDLVFLDPPYSKGLALQCLKSICSSIQTSPNSCIIVEERSNEQLPSTVSDFTLSDKRKYGDTAFWFYRKSKSNLMNR